MTRKRSRLEIYIDILKTIRSGTNKPTNIMYRCNLSWIPLREILNSLIDQSLVEVVDKENRRTYEVTEKGRDVLRYFEKAEDLLVIHTRHGKALFKEKDHSEERISPSQRLRNTLVTHEGKETFQAINRLKR